MTERKHQNNRKAQVCQQDNNAVFDRRAGIAASKEVRRQSFNQNISRQADGIGNNGFGGHDCFGVAELAVLEQNIDNRFGKNNQRYGRRNGQQSAVFKCFGLNGLCLFGLAGFDMARQDRQHGNADGRADNSQRQLLQAVGVIEPGNGAGTDHRNQNSVDNHVDLIDAGTEYTRRDAFEQCFYFGIFNDVDKIVLRFDINLLTVQKIGQPQNFNKAGCRNAKSNAVGGRRAERDKNKLLANKLHLHAYKIDLSSVYGKKMVVKAKLPDYFKESLKLLGLNLGE